MRLAPIALPLVLAAASFAQPTPSAQSAVDPTAKREANLAGGAIATGPATLDKATREKGERVAARAIEWLRKQQDEKTGAWGLPPAGKGPAYPAISGLIVNGMLLQPGIDAKDPAVVKAVGYLLSQQQSDGGVYDRVLPVYNTGITLSALSRVDTDEARAAIKKAQDFLRNSQWGTTTVVESPDKPREQVGPEHPFYGGWGYGRHSRPDISNGAFAIQGLADTGVPNDDPAVKRALVFLQRLQMQEKGVDGKVINDQPYAKGSQQGGFIYAPSKDDKTLGTGDSEADNVDETLTTGETKSMMRAYGSVTYAGFKGYIYAGLKKDDPRVQAVLDFVSRNYTLTENPGIKTDGMYYYYVMFSRAMRASQMDTVNAKGADGKAVPHNWRADLIDQLASIQNEDGSFKVISPRWMENNPTLITAYGLVAIENALR
jgi:squalene-hopene/tetraprenyl-beta-curcumene cyclase